jgi:hypothetical protein
MKPGSWFIAIGGDLPLNSGQKSKKSQTQSVQDGIPTEDRGNEGFSMQLRNS